MNRRSLSPRCRLRINWADGNSEIYDCHFVWIRSENKQDRYCFGTPEVLIHTECGRIWLDAGYASYTDDGCGGEANSPNGPSRKGKGRIRKTTRKKTK